MKIGTLAIGAAGELLVQYKLLKLGIDSARLTTDSGIDLVMYVPGSREAATIQVKTKLSPESGAATGHPAIGMSFPHDCKAQWLACVDLSRDMAWLFSLDQARELAQQQRGGTRVLYWFTDGFVGRKTRPESEFDGYRLESVVDKLLQGESGSLP